MSHQSSGPLGGQEESADASARPPENPLVPTSTVKNISQDLVDGVKDGISGVLFTGLMYAGIFLAVILPVAGLIVGGLLLWFAIAQGSSKFLPIMTLVASVVFWFMGQSPLGMLPLILAIL